MIPPFYLNRCYTCNNYDPKETRCTKKLDIRASDKCSEYERMDKLILETYVKFRTGCPYILIGACELKKLQLMPGDMVKITIERVDDAEVSQ